MPTLQTLQETIRAERRSRESFKAGEVLDWINRGEIQRALDDLIYFASPATFQAVIESLEQACREEGGLAENYQGYLLKFLAGLTLALRSSLPLWNLKDASQYGEAALSAGQVSASADCVHSLALRLAVSHPDLAESYLAHQKAETLARLKAEQDPDPRAAIENLVGGSLGEYLDNVSRALENSHLRRLTNLRFAGQTVTELSNDFAAFLPYALYLGASFATTNPPLVNLAWNAEPERWDKVAGEILVVHPEADGPTLVRWLTLEVVYAQMCLLRPIFLLKEGTLGCVCLQVAPTNHANAESMVNDALFFYEQFQGRFEGGIPNVVFKLPGTRAGLEACRALTGRGIGVTITVNFGLFQHFPFARAIQEGQAIYSCLVEMNGRLSFPVRDELLGKLEILAAYGIDEGQARRAAAWAGVAVAKRLHRWLEDEGYDQARIRPLIASLRIYTGELYQGLPSAFPDITELTGTRIISVFPNVRRPFDAQAEILLEPNRIEDLVPEEALAVLVHSEIFKQAYYAGLGDESRFQPERVLSLEDETGTFGWTPVNATLTEFIQAYQATEKRLLERRG